MRVVVADDGEGRTGELARRLGLELVAAATPPDDALLLCMGEDGLVLREPGPEAAGPLRVDFRPVRASTLLRRATLAGKEGIRRMVDATAGLGHDSFAIAQEGVEVVLVERSPVVAALLADGLERAMAHPRTRAAAERMQLLVGEAAHLLPRLEPADVVYLDPMYPRSGREGRKAKEMRVLRALLGDDRDAEELLTVARAAASRRVVVKRPLKAPPLAGERPSGSLKGTTVRYDLYAPVAKSSTAGA